MRCLALAQAWQDSGRKAVFVANSISSPLMSRLRSEQIEVVYLDGVPGSPDDATYTANLAHDLGSKWVVVDGYHFGSGYQRSIKESGLSLLFIDDNGHAKEYFADIVLNQNLHADEKLYRQREPYTRLLLGTQYVLLRREFLRWQGWTRDIRSASHKVLVTLGGSDADNVTLKVIQALDQLNVYNLEATVISGASNPNYEGLINAINGSKSIIKLESNVRDISKLMAWADVAVSAGGTTSWELAFMGLPSCTIIIAENQRHIAKLLDARGIAVCLGWHEEVSSKTIAEELKRLLFSTDVQSSMIEIGQDAVDGNGAMRVIMALMDK